MSDPLPGRVVGLQLEVESQCVVELRHDGGWDVSEDGAQLPYRDRADLLGVGSSYGA